jgi:Putative DNA-binding domain
MASLLDFQRSTAASLLEGGDLCPGLQGHQEKVLSTVLHALGLSFPSVARLTGPEYFARLARGYWRAHPPHNAILGRYGEDFPDYLRSHTNDLHYPYLYDLARFDWHIDRVSREPVSAFRSPLAVAPRLRMRLPRSLRFPRFEYSVDRIRDALGARQRDDLTSADLSRRARWFAVWRGTEGACVEPVSEAAATFLSRLIESPSAEGAFTAAVHAEIVSGSFAHFACSPELTIPRAP